jgi:hypothetical protein
MAMDQSNRIERAIEQLTAISIDLKAMLAVHEERLNKQEKNSDDLYSTVEKRREELDVKLKDVYDTMRTQDNGILEEISKLRKESTEQHNVLSNKINQLEKYIWVAIGGGMTVICILSYVANYFKVLGH